METIDTIAGLRRALDTARRAGRRVGFVPTMGVLHAGHVSLIEQARQANDVVVVSVFVNPLQFGPNEDLDRYPRPFAEDQQAAANAGADYVFHPAVGEMYPDGPVRTCIEVGPLSEPWEGTRRPGHFAGMATVVAKLFQIAGPCTAYFGEKDWQQLLIVRQMVRDLSIPVTVAAVPTTCEADGMALSSRNAYLDVPQRRAAAAISEGLRRAVRLFADGTSDAGDIRSAALEALTAERSISVDYVAIVDDQLLEVALVTEDSRMLISATVGETHLIDNAGFVEGELRRLEAAEE